MCDHRIKGGLHMETFEEAVPLYLKACEVEGKTERTVQSYAEDPPSLHPGSRPAPTAHLG